MTAQRSIVLAAAILFVAGCNGGGGGIETSAPTTAPATTALPTSTTARTTTSSSATPQSTRTTTTITTTTTSVAPTTTTTSVAPTTTTTRPPVAALGGVYLVMNEAGVWQVDATGSATLLVAGRVTTAVDDTQGGLLYQLDRGRVWDEEDQASTVIWWVPRGANAPQELVVPTAGSGQRLTLHDAYRTDDGFAVLYTRHDGSIPDVDMVDRLRRLEIPGGTVTELFAGGAFEQGFGDVTSNGTLIAGIWFQLVGSGCFILDLEGRPLDLVPGFASDPYSDEYVRGCRLSPAGDQLTVYTDELTNDHVASTTIQVWDLLADEEVHRFVIPADLGWAKGIDTTARAIIANRIVDGIYIEALVMSLDAPDAAPIALPIAGEARFLDAPVDIAPITLR